MQSAIGEEIKNIMSTGQFVNDDLVVSLVSEKNRFSGV